MRRRVAFKENQDFIEERGSEKKKPRVKIFDHIIKRGIVSDR